MRFFAPLAVFTLVACLASCRTERSSDTQAAEKAAAPSPVSITAPTATTNPTAKAFPAIADQSLLHNAHIVTDKVISGAQPEGDASFQALKDLGVKTIISVDGAAPDIERAKKYGIRYVHLPIGYNGVSPETGKAIAKAIDEMPGEIYVHCHHGKHRSAAAVAVACVYNGSLKPEQAEDVLKTFGTGENYTGLWKAARDAKPVPAGELKNLNVEFVEAAKITKTAEAMVAVDERWDHLKAVQKAGWKPPADHPDIDPAHEALQLQELLTEMRRADSAHMKIEDFQKRSSEAEAGAKALHAALSEKPVNSVAAEAAFKAVGASCTSCHKSYRD